MLSVVFFSYWTKHKSPAGDQFLKFSRQSSIFGHIGDQWVTISSPERNEDKKNSDFNGIQTHDLSDTGVATKLQSQLEAGHIMSS